MWMFSRTGTCKVIEKKILNKTSNTAYGCTGFSTSDDAVKRREINAYQRKCFLRYRNPFLVNVPILYLQRTPGLFVFSGDIKWEIGQKWVHCHISKYQHADTVGRESLVVNIGNI